MYYKRGNEDKDSFVAQIAEVLFFFFEMSPTDITTIQNDKHGL